MRSERLTMAQAIARFPAQQHGEQAFFNGVVGIHGMRDFYRAWIRVFGGACGGLRPRISKLTAQGWHVTAGAQAEQDSNQASRAPKPDRDDAIVTSIPAHEGAGLLPCGFLAGAGTHPGCLHASRRIVVAMSMGADSAR